MLKYFSSSQDYKEFLKTEKSSLSTSDLFRLSSPKYKSAIHKLSKLDVDLVVDIIFPLYSPLGRPANDPAIYLRSFVLMLNPQKPAPYFLLAIARSFIVSLICLMLSHFR